MNCLKAALFALIIMTAGVRVCPAPVESTCELFGGGVDSKDRRLTVTADGFVTMRPTLPADRFDGKCLDSEKWRVQSLYGGVADQDGHLTLRVSGEHRGSAVTLTTPYRFRGDFDVQVAFKVLDGWTPPGQGHVDGTVLGFIAGGHDQRITLNLHSTGAQRVTAYSFRNGLLATTEHPAKQGKYRIARRGPNVEFYYAAGRRWRSLCVAAAPLSEAEVYLSAGSADTTLGFSAAFDNFQVNSGVTTYPDTAGLTTCAFELSGGALLRSLRVNADIPRDSYVTLKLYGKERRFPEWRLLGEYRFDREHKELPIEPPAYAEGVKLGVAAGDGARLVMAGATNSPVLRSVQLLTCAPHPIPDLTVVEPKPNAVEKWGVYELALSNPDRYDNPFWDVLVTGLFEGPKSQRFVVEGFYDGDQTWRIRFAPTAEGAWKYSVRFTSRAGTAVRSGEFECKPAGEGNHGFIRISRKNPHAFEYSDGAAFIPAGIAGHTPAVGAALLGFEAGESQVADMWRYLSEKRVTAYRLQMFHQTMAPQVMEWNPSEGHANLLMGSGGLDRYNTSNARLIDRWLAETQRLEMGWILSVLTVFDISIYPFKESYWSSAMGGPYANLDDMYWDSSGKGFDLQMKYLRYLANRWSAYRNVWQWELNNEFGARTSQGWLRGAGEVMEQHDAYSHPATVSFWSREWSSGSSINDSAAVKVTDDHLYATSLADEFRFDTQAHNEAQARYSRYRKPVVFSEYGAGSEIWSADAAVKWRTTERVGYWAAFVGGGFPVFWLSGNNTPEGHRYNRGILDLLSQSRDIVSNVRDYLSMRPNDRLVAAASPDVLRAYCMASDNEALVYVHHYRDHSTKLRGQTIRVTLPPSRDYKAKWFDPASGKLLDTGSGSSGQGSVSLTLPEFTTDLVLYLSCFSGRTAHSGDP